MAFMRKPATPGVQNDSCAEKKVCKFCVDKIDYIDYKDTRLLFQFIPERGKILPRRISGVCAPHQRKLMEALKRARNIACCAYSN
jgi:small subunit ribosomal protein S18